MAETDNMNLALPGSNEYVDVEVLNENFRKIDAAVLMALAAAAPYSAKTYPLGAYCTRGGRLYRCTTAITVAETWTAGHWTETTVTAELIAHATSKSNPHGVTAAQTGAYSKSETDTLLAKKANTADFQSHATSKSNPHGVTAAQTGAYTKAETNTLLDNKVNTWNGSVNDCNTANKIGKYNVNSSTLNCPDGQAVNGDILLVIPWDINTIYQQYFAVSRKRTFVRYSIVGNASVWSDWEKIVVPTDLVDRAKIAIGSYVGTGMYSSANPNSLTFDFEPKVVIIVQNSHDNFPGTVFIRGQTLSGTIGENYISNSQLTVGWSGNTVTWYTNNSSYKDRAQLNISGNTYFYVALG